MPVLASPLLKVGRQYLFHHYQQTILMVMGISLGVAMVIGIDIANESASRAFELSTEAVTGRATHVISGGPDGIAESLYSDIMLEGLDVPAAPIISDYIIAAQLDGQTIQLLGIDPFAEAPFRDYLVDVEGVSFESLVPFLSKPGGILISQNIAKRYGLNPESEFVVEYAGRTHELIVAGLLDPADELSRRALDGLILADISTAQELTGRIGLIDKIDLILAENEKESVQKLQGLLPSEVRLLPVDSRSGTVEQITAAFKLNLTALSLLALVVALFLIYNTMTFSVVQRRRLFGILRSLGVTRRELFLMVVSEALVIGVMGSAVGMAAGILFGRGTVNLVSQTINDLFFVTTVRDIPIAVSSLVKGAALGVLATVAAAAFPAWEAASVTPRAALSRANLESKARKIVRGLGVAGVLVILFGFCILAISKYSLVFSFLGTFIAIIGFALITPIFTVWIMRLAVHITSRIWGVLGRMAPREVVNSISRTSVAVAALMMAIAVTVGFSLMVGSFRFTVETWMSQILHGDVYISVPGATASQPLYSIDPEALSILEKFNGVARVDLLQTAIVNSPEGPIQISANNNPNDGLEQVYLAADYPVEKIWEIVEEGAVLVSEPLANRLDLPRSRGQLSLYTDYGLRNFPIAGVYYDYGSSQGNVIMSLGNYQNLWQDDRIAAAALILEPGMDVQSVVDEVKGGLSPIQSLLVQSNRELREETLRIFDRTFTIVSALQLLTAVVAFIGVLSAMMSLQLDKQRQLGILKAIGLTGRQLWRMVTLEAGLMGAVAGLLSMPAGLMLAVILVYIINRRSFSWTLQLQLELEPFILALLIGMAAAMLAGLYPAYRIIHRNTAEAIRYE